MDLHLKDKTVLITAGSAGIGLATAKRFANEGARVFITGRDAQKLEVASAEIAKLGSVQAIVADAGTAEGAETIVSELPDANIVINNLGVYPPRAFFDITDAEWLDIFETNVLGGVRLCRHYLSRMLEAGRGRIIFISSESAILVPPSTLHYGMTKAAQLAVSRGLAEMTKGTQVTVNSILPGPTWSEGALAFLRSLNLGEAETDQEREREFFRQIKPTSLIERFIKPEEVADMAAYIASPLASATNGAAVKVEGGVVPSLS